MLLTLHGTGAGEPGGDRLASALTARFSDDSIVLFDAGEGCSRAMLRDKLDLHRISTVAISHMHADHWGGLPNLIMGWGTGERKNPVDIYIPEKTGEFFERLLITSYMFRERLTFDINFHTLAPFDMPDGWRAELFATTHLKSVREHADKHGITGTAYGYRLLNGKRKIILSQDIGGEDDLAEEMEGAELVVCESAHAEPEKILAMAREQNVKRVIFTHIPPKDVAFPEKFEGIEWSIAEEGDTIEL